VPAELEDWWTLKQAADFLDLDSEAVRRWARQNPPRVASTEFLVGKKRRVLVSAADIRREAKLPRQRRRRREGAQPNPAAAAPAVGIPAGQGGNTYVRVPDNVLDRLSVMEEIVQRRRIIDERRQEIESLHREIEVRLNQIAEDQRDIEGLLSGPSFAPNT